MSPIDLYPAIDIRDGQAVRLLQGDYDRQTTYDADPLDAARRWLDAGAAILHVVDLDGARAGRPANLEAIERIAAAAGDIGVPIQVGGGLRDVAAVEAVLSAGASRAVLGTRAQREPEFVGELVGRHGAERVVASVDAKGGLVAVEGWEETTSTPVVELVETLATLGARRFVCTPVEVDGTLEGPGLEGIEAIAAACGRDGGELVYSGGIGSLEDLRRLRELEIDGLGGVIVGRALYEQRFGIAEGIEALGGRVG